MTLSEDEIDLLSERVIAKLVSAPGAGQTVNPLLEKLLNALAVSPTVFGGGWDRIDLGQNVKLVNALLNVSSGRISIGDHTFCGHNVSLLTGSHFIHHTDDARQAYPSSGRDIVIGRGVWLASNSTVLGPCTIGDNAVVAAGSVVVGGDLQNSTLYAGVPAKKVR